MAANDERIEQFRQLTELDPEDELGFFGLATELQKAGRHAEAAAAFARVLELKPDYSVAYRGLGCAYRDTQQIDKARETFTKGIEVARKNGDLQTVKEMEVFLRRLAEC